MKPSKELDALVAEHVMGLVEYVSYAGPHKAVLGWGNKGSVDIYHLKPLPKYSTDIASAWVIVEKMKGCVPLELSYDNTMMEWICRINEFSESSDFAPHAICLAALKSVNYKL